MGPQVGLLGLPPAAVQGSIKTGRELSNPPVSTAGSGRSRTILWRVVGTNGFPPPARSSSSTPLDLIPLHEVAALPRGGGPFLRWFLLRCREETREDGF